MGRQLGRNRGGLLARSPDSAVQRRQARAEASAASAGVLGGGSSLASVTSTSASIAAQQSAALATPYAAYVGVISGDGGGQSQFEQGA